MENQSILICDLCKNVLDSPILLPCEHTICKKHITKQACLFCPETHSHFTELKKLENLIGKLRTAKSSYSRTKQKLDEFATLKSNSAAFLDEKFSEIKQDLIQQKQLVLTHLANLVEQRHNQLIENLNNLKEECLDRLDSKHLTSFDQMSEYKTKLSEWDQDLNLRNIKISETTWEKITNESTQLNASIDDKLKQLKNSLMLNLDIKFVADLTELNEINYGSLSIKSVQEQPVINSTTNQVNQSSRATFEPISSSIQTAPDSNSNFEASLDSAAKPKLYQRILGHLNYVFCVSFDRKGEFIITGSDDKLIKIWRASDGLLVATLRGHTREITDLDVDYDNLMLASGGIDKKVRIWNLNTTQNTQILDQYCGISCVKFSPYCRGNKRWLVSADFLLYFWEYDFDKYYIEKPPVKFKQDTKIICISFSPGGSFLVAGTKGSVLVFYFSEEKPIKLANVDINSHEVNSIQYANKLNKFISGSKDGTVRVWGFEHKKKWSSITIDTSFSNKPANPSHRFFVTMCVWNADDSLIITAQNNQQEYSIKVWNSSTGALMHEFENAHSNNTFVLEPHPNNPNLLISAAHDGYVILWNVSDGVVLEKFYNEIGDQGMHGGVYDLKWSPKLDMFAATDSHGHLSLFGYGNPGNYKNVPDDQFFHTDYHAIIKDRYNITLDKKSGIQPHLLPPPLLINSLNAPYELKYQRLVQGRENMSQNEYDERKVMFGDGSFELMDDFDYQTFKNSKDSSQAANTQNFFKTFNCSVKNIVKKLNQAEIQSDVSSRLAKLENEEKYFRDEFKDFEVVKEKVSKRDRRNENASTDDTEEENLSKSSDVAPKASKSKALKRVLLGEDKSENEESSDEFEDDLDDEYNDDFDDEFYDDESEPTTSHKTNSKKLKNSKKQRY